MISIGALRGYMAAAGGVADNDPEGLSSEFGIPNSFLFCIKYSFPVRSLLSKVFKLTLMLVDLHVVGRFSVVCGEVGFAEVPK